MVVRAPTQVSRLRVAEIWPKPVKWCSTMKVAVIAERLGLDVVFHEFAEAGAAVDVGPSASGLGAPEQSEPHALVLPFDPTPGRSAEEASHKDEAPSMS